MIFVFISRCSSLILTIIWLTTIGVSFSTSLRAQEIDDENVINWYYANEFGTGAYKVGDSTVEIFRIPLSYTLSHKLFDNWTVKLLFPITFGYHNFKYEIKDIIDKVFEEGFATVTLAPGAELQIPLNSDTVLFPYAYAGYGKETTGNSRAWLYGVGIRIIDEHQWKASAVSLGGAFTFAGYSSNDNENRATSSVRVGFNITTPFNAQIFGKPGVWGTHFITYFYFNELDFESEERQPLQIDHEFEVALTLGTQTPMSFLGAKFDRFGFAYRWGKNLEAIRLIASFPF